MYRQESNLAISSSPVTKTMYSYIWAYCCCVKRKEIFSSAPVLSVMTHRECCVDRPFPFMWLGNVWEPAPPPCSTGQSQLFNPCFPGLNLRHRRCHMDLWLAILVLIHHRPHQPRHHPLLQLQDWSTVFPFSQSLLSLAGCLLPNCASGQSCFKPCFLLVNCHESSFLFGPLGPHLAASVVAHWAATGQSLGP